jgi:CHAT domain-containing protein
MGRRRQFALFILAVLFALPEVRPASAQGDPMALQASAVRRIDASVDHIRRTGDMRSRLPDLMQAEAELAASNRMLEAQGAWSALAIGLIKQGHIFRLQANWANAVALYGRAEEAAKRGRDVVQQADALAWRAFTDSSRRNLGQAIADATQAVRLAETTDDKDLLARALDVLGAVQVNQRDLAGAADTVNRELAVALQAKDPMAAYYAYLNRADVHQKFGERCDFQRTFEACYQALDRAGLDLQQALEVTRRLGYLALTHQTERIVAGLEQRRALVKSQETMHRTMQTGGLFAPKKPGDVLSEEKFVASPGAGHIMLLADVMRGGAKQLGGHGDMVEARSRFVEGMMAEMQGNNDAALASFLKAVDLLERERRALRDERSRGTALEDRINFYYAAMAQQLERRRYAEAFELLERARSRSLAELIASRQLGLGRPEEQQLYTQWTVLRTHLGDAQSALFELVNQPDAASHAARINTLQARIRNLEAEDQAVASRMAAEAPRLQSLVTSQPASLAALQRSMREEGYEMLQYLVLDDGVILWHVAPDSVFVRKVFLPRSTLMAKVSALQKGLADAAGPFDETIARELFLFLVQPALDRIAGERLVIIPHGDLHYVPFEVFQDPTDRRYLGERFQITYAPSASVLLGLAKSPGLSGGRLLAVADPALQAAGPEVRSIAALFPGQSKIVTDGLARKSDLKAWIRDFDVVHLAVHGKFDSGEPMLSYLALAAGAGEDGRLTAAEMFGLPLQGSRLVVLSACETGRAEATHGNEVLGIVRGLIYAGAGSLVLSRWKVDSEATAVWMESFYQAALSQPFAQAARIARSRVKRDPKYGHPFYWAAFTTIGR